MSDQVVPSSNKQIVIIGGGQAGRDTARLLVKSKNSNTSVVIIQPHTYSYSPTLMPWWLEHHKQIEGKWNTGKSTVGDIERLCIPGVKYAFGEATEVSTSAKTVTVVSNEGTAKTTNTISYDALIVATGIFYPLASPDSQYTDLEALKKLYCEELPTRIGAAKSILIGGAGPVACEMANTLRSLNQSCKITMVTSGENAIPEWTGTAASKVKGQLKRMNVDLVKNERLRETKYSLESGTYTLTKSGSTIDADIFLPYFGTAATAFMPAGTTEENSGRVLVNDQGQCTKAPTIFAVGVGDKIRMSLADNISAEAKVVAANAESFINGRALSKSIKKPVKSRLDYMHFGMGTYTIINPEFPGNVCCTLMGCPLCFFCPCCMACGWNGCFPASKIGSVFMEHMVVTTNGAPPHADFKRMHSATTPAAATMSR